MRILTKRIMLLLACSWFAGLVQAESYYFTTIVGQPGVSGSTDGTNNQALLYRPSDLALDSSGVLYVSDTFNNTIRQITPTGNDWIVSTVAGSAEVTGSLDGTNGEAQFNRPNGLAVDPAGNLVVADHNNHTIRKIAPEDSGAVVTTLVGFPGVFGTNDGVNADARFRVPMGVAVNPSGSIFVADTANFTIRMVAAESSNWVASTIAGTSLNFGLRDGLSGAASFNYPYGLALGPDGALYVTDAGNNAIRQVTLTSKGWNTKTVANFQAVAGSQDGPARFASFDTPNGIALDNRTNIYVADQRNHTIRKMTFSGRDWDVATIGGVPGLEGTSDGIGTNALFRMPWGIAVDRAGAIYVADAYNHTIRRGVPFIALQIAAYATYVVVSWPTTPEGFQLEMTRNLSDPAKWTCVTSGILLTGNRYTFTNNLTARPTFFRLRR